MYGKFLHAKILPNCAILYVIRIVLQMSNVQDQLDEIYGQLVELNNVIDQNVTNAIVYVI